MQKSSNGLVVIVMLILVAIAGYAFFYMQDNRTGAEKVGDAISELPNGIDDAARQLENRTPAEKVGDAVEDATDGNPQ